MPCLRCYRHAVLNVRSFMRQKSMVLMSKFVKGAMRMVGAASTSDELDV